MQPGAKDGAATDRLSAALGGKLPAGAEALTAEELADLADAIEAAQKRQSEALTQAAEDALGFVPRLLRGTVRKIVFR